MKAFLERKIPIGHVTGTSAGAWLAFYLATKIPMGVLKKMVYSEPGPLGKFIDVLDYIDPEERGNQFNSNIHKIVEKAKGNSHLTNAIHMSVWTLFNMTKGLHWIGAHDAKTMA